MIDHHSSENDKYLQVAISKITWEDATRILQLREHRELTVNRQGQMILKALETESKWSVQVVGEIIHEVAKKWGQFEPPTAAAWALRIPHRRLGEIAVNRIYLEWLKYDEDEARAWGLSLDKNYRDLLDLE